MNVEKLKKTIEKHIVGSSIECIRFREMLTLGKSVNFSHTVYGEKTSKFNIVPDGTRMLVNFDGSGLIDVGGFVPFDDIDIKYLSEFKRTSRIGQCIADDELVNSYFRRFE